MNLSDFVFDPLEEEVMLEDYGKLAQECLDQDDEARDFYVNGMLFKSAMDAAGIAPPELMNDDGKVHFIPLGKKEGSGLGWYLFAPDRKEGAFGVVQKWSSSDETTTK